MKKESKCSLFYLNQEWIFLLHFMIQVVLLSLLKYIGNENKLLINYIEYIKLYVLTHIFYYINFARITLF